MFRIGYGWDSHRFKAGIPLKIGGVTLPHDRGLAGHSDGDVLLHALTDALLGGVAAGDIGAYFPSNDKKWKGADSVVFINEALKKVAKAGYAVSNVDCTLILSTPKIGPHARRIQTRVAELLRIAPADVGIKAKTPEGMGTDNAAIAHVAVLLVKRGIADDQRLETAEAIPQPEVDEVVEQMLRGVAPGKSRVPKVHARH